MFKMKSYWAMKPRLKLAYEKIQIVRSARGKKAQGDALLLSAKKALRFNALHPAKKDIENFLHLARDVTPEHAAILSVEYEYLSRRWYLKLRPPPIRECLILVAELLRWLANKHPLSCQRLGESLHLYRCLSHLKI